MICIQGKGVSKGVEKGKVYICQRPDRTVVKRAADLETEKTRLAVARRKRP